MRLNPCKRLNRVQILFSIRMLSLIPLLEALEEAARQ
jgi:hypothetical protein